MVRPGVPRLERCVAPARAKAHEETVRQWTPWLTDERHTWLDGRWHPDASTGRPRLRGLRQDAVSHAASPSMAPLTTSVLLHDAGVDQWHLARRKPNRAPWAAPIGWKSPQQSVPRPAPARRSPVLVAFLQPALRQPTDVPGARCDQGLGGGPREAQPE